MFAHRSGIVPLSIDHRLSIEKMVSQRAGGTTHTIEEWLYITKTCLFKYIENFTTKKEKKNNQIKNSDSVHISCSKHRLWVLVRTASARRF